VAVPPQPAASNAQATAASVAPVPRTTVVNIVNLHSRGGWVSSPLGAHAALWFDDWARIATTPLL
jgi:hypothetical protein